MKNLADRLSRLRNYYRLKRKVSVGGLWLPLLRRRLRARAKRTPIHAAVRVEPGNLLIPVRSDDQATNNVLYRGRIAPDLEWVIEKYVEPGTIAIDVGANLGLVSALMAISAGADGEVWSVEPNPQMHARIRELFWLNRLENLRIVPCACSDTEGDAHLAIDAADHTRSQLSQSPAGVPVQVTTLDKLLDGTSKRVSFIKLDVEGHESQALAGARTTIRTHRPAVVFEMLPHAAQQVRQIGEILSSLDYEVVGVLREWGVQRGELCPEMTRKSHCNVLALPKAAPRQD